ncbi:reverse transcriptase N-terminal domain-containing protein [Limnospira platensis]|uniref:reverse transcriptase N-terminal domain-containing protein n=1 Tax=Limnospira platensis TaxID=118562 RepID=UPI003D700A7E
MAIASLKRGFGKPRPIKTTNNAWKAIPWTKVQRKVFKLQKSIFQAAKSGQDAKARRFHGQPCFPTVSLINPPPRRVKARRQPVLME